MKYKSKISVTFYKMIDQQLTCQTTTISWYTMISEAILIKQLSILLISAIKLMVAAPISYLFGYSYLHTLINTTAGGVLGVLFFYFLSRSLFRLYRNYLHRFYTITSFFKGKSGQIQPIRSQNPKPKKKFNRRNRLIVRIRSKYGMPGIIILTPVLLSIPLGTFLAMKYYSRKRNLIVWLSLSVIIWSVLLTTFVELFWSGKHSFYSSRICTLNSNEGHGARGTGHRAATAPCHLLRSMTSNHRSTPLFSYSLRLIVS